MFAHKDISRDACMLTGHLAKKGYDWWWHSFTAVNDETGQEKAFFIEYFLCNPAFGQDEPVLGQLKENQEAGIRPSYLMVKAGCWGNDAMQLHRFFGWKQIQVHYHAPYEITADDCHASETELKGSISITPEECSEHPEWMCDAGALSWDLKVFKMIPFNVGYGASGPLRKAEAFAMFWHAEGMKTVYTGHLTCNGQRYTVHPESCYGYADKNWGRDFTSPWVWLSSNDLVSAKTGRRLDNSVFDIGGGRPQIYFVPLDRRLLGVMYYEGEEFDFNFSKLHLHVKTDFSFDEDEEKVYWHVRQESVYAVMETEISCRKEEMLKVNYEAPDGSKKHNNLWNGGTGSGTIRLWRKKEGKLVEVDEIIAGHVGCEYGEYD